MHLCFFLGSSAHIRQLDLDGIVFEIDAVHVLSDALTYNLHYLEILSLSHCQLDSESVMQLLSSNKRNVPVVFYTLIKLDITFNNITDKAISVLIRSFIQMPKLQSVDVQGNQYIIALNLVLGDLKRPVKSVDYSSRHNSLDMIAAFISVLGCMSSVPLERSNQIENVVSLCTLNLKCSGSESMLILSKDATSFVKQFVALTELNLSGLWFEENAIDHLADALTHCLHLLQSLTLSHCNLDSDAVLTLFCFSEENFPVSFHTLSELDLSFNYIMDDAIIPLIKSFLQIPGIKFEKLNMSDNYFSNPYNFDVLCDISLHYPRSIE